MTLHPPPTVGRIELHTYDLTLVRNGAYDPTTRVRLGSTTNGQAPHLAARIERATLTPEGPGTIAVNIDADGQHRIESWGPGAGWLSARHLRLTARSTECLALQGHHPVVQQVLRTMGQLHLPATDTPYHEVLPAILGQRITAAQAVAQWARLCERYGDAAPGPLSLRLPPTPPQLLRIASWELHRLGIEQQRARTLRVAARHAAFIDRTRDLDGPAARRALMQLPGIGVWTAAVAIGVSHGDPDALPIGDFHVKNTVAWALTGKPRGTDDEMIATLAPYVGQRWQLVRLLERSGLGAPQFAPKRKLLNIARL